MLQTILISLAVLVGAILIVLLISFLVSRTKRMDSKEKFIDSLLPGLDCGKCGKPSCQALAKEVAAETADIASCPFISANNLNKAKMSIKKGYYNNNNLVACVLCKGGKDCKNKFNYTGLDYCWSKESLHSGNKACEVGCLGCGDCVKVCRYHAISINSKGTAEVDRTKCTGCGACTYVCPNNLIVRLPVNQSVCCLCQNNIDKSEIGKLCKVGCISCGACAKVCPTRAISMVDGLPSVDTQKCIHCNRCVGVCPNSCISRL